MPEIIEPTEKHGWAEFSQCCDIVVEKLSPATDAILAARREGVTGPESVRIFIHAFEAAIEASRDEATWSRLNGLLVSAGEDIRFRPPHFQRAAKGDVVQLTKPVVPRLVFASFARCVAAAVARCRKIPPQPSSLSSEFTMCRQAWESETFEYDIIAPIAGIHPIAPDALSISDGMTLVYGHRVLSDSSTHLLETFENPLRFQSPTVLTGRRTLLKSGDFESFCKRAIADLTRCITALRLATGKTVSCDTVHVVPSAAYYQTFNVVFNHFRSLPETSTRGERDLLGSPFTDADAAQARDVAALLAAESASQLSIATERFNYAMGRFTPEDQVIDLAIALESTICRGGGNEQLSYRFRLFGAAILADVSESEHIVKVLGSLYSARSKVVHAGARLGDLIRQTEFKTVFPGHSVAQLVERYRELTRLVLLEFLQQAANGRSPEEYIRALESAMVRTAKISVRGG